MTWHRKPQHHEYVIGWVCWGALVSLSQCGKVEIARIQTILASIYSFICMPHSIFFMKWNTKKSLEISRKKNKESWHKLLLHLLSVCNKDRQKKRFPSFTTTKMIWNTNENCFSSEIVDGLIEYFVCFTVFTEFDHIHKHLGCAWNHKFVTQRLPLETGKSGGQP